MFNINFHNIVDSITPAVMQRIKFKEYLYSAVKPIQSLHSIFYNFYNQINYQLKFNAQVIYLEHYLNDLYDPTNRGIYIEDVANINYTYIYNKIEGRLPLYLYNNSEIPPQQPLHIKHDSELVTTLDFIVKVPIAVTYVEIIMKNQIKKYNIAGKRFAIQTY